MPRSLRHPVVALLPFCLICCGVSAAHAQSDDGYSQPTSVADFYDALSPYGEWMTIPAYGRVWRPFLDYVGPDFVPYLTGGQWTYSDYGWYFSSIWDDQFGWAVFHYGRWAQDGQLGWLWFPDIRWGASWVQWNSNYHEVAWYPLAPTIIQTQPVAWIIVSADSFPLPDVQRFVRPTRPQLQGRPLPPPQGNATVVLVARGKPPYVAGPPPAPPQPLPQPSYQGGSDPGNAPAPYVGSVGLVGAAPAWWAGNRYVPPRPVSPPVGTPAAPVPIEYLRPSGPRTMAAPTMTGGGGLSRPSTPAAPVMRATPPSPPSSGGGPSMRATPPSSSGGGSSMRATPPGKH